MSKPDMRQQKNVARLVTVSLTAGAGCDHTRGMKLNEFLAEKQIPVSVFAQRIGVRNARTVYRYLSGDRRPSPDIMRNIFRETGGMVTPIDFYGDLVPGGHAAQRSTSHAHEGGNG